MVKEFDFVFVKDGSKGTIVDMPEGRDRFLMEVDGEDGTEVRDYSVSDVLAVWKKSENSFVSFVATNNKAIAS